MYSIDVCSRKDQATTLDRSFLDVRETNGFDFALGEHEIMRIHMQAAPQDLLNYQTALDAPNEAYPMGFDTLSLVAVTALGIILWGEINIPNGKEMKSFQACAFTKFFIPFTNVLCIEILDNQGARVRLK